MPFQLPDVNQMTSELTEKMDTVDEEEPTDLHVM